MKRQLPADCTCFIYNLYPYLSYHTKAVDVIFIRGGERGVTGFLASLKISLCEDRRLKDTEILEGEDRRLQNCQFLGLKIWQLSQKIEVLSSYKMAPRNTSMFLYRNHYQPS